MPHVIWGHTVAWPDFGTLGSAVLPFARPWPSLYCAAMLPATAKFALCCRSCPPLAAEPVLHCLLLRAFDMRSKQLVRTIETEAPVLSIEVRVEACAPCRGSLQNLSARHTPAYCSGNGAS